jgi:hypothetical protein
LNALANHDYLPRDGRNIGFWQLVVAQQEAYNLSYPLAILLALGGILLCGHWRTLSLSLSDLSKHNKIEHDGSLVHADACTGDAQNVDDGLMDDLLDQCTAFKGTAFSVDDYLRVKIKRDDSLAVPLDGLHSEIARGEFGLTFHMFGEDRDGKRIVRKERLESWLRHEKLPDDWVAPKEQTGIRTAVKQSKEFKRLVQARRNKM